MAMRKSLRSFRGSMCLTQQEMADKIGVSNQQYFLVEAGRRNGSMEFWTDLQNAFGLPDEKVWQMMKEGGLDA